MAIEHYAGIPCALTVMPTKSFATVGGIIEINLIALVNDARRRKEVIVADLPEMAACGPHLKVGEFLLPSGLMAVGYDGRITGSDVSSSFVSLAHPVVDDEQPGALQRCQHAWQPALATGGGELGKQPRRAPIQDREAFPAGQPSPARRARAT